MVKLKYSALYTDNLGCEQAEVYFSMKGFQLKVRNNIFNNDNFSFDFYADNSNDISHLFYFKDDELIDYAIDIKIPIILTYKGNECIKEFLLRIERQKNQYNNSLSLFLNNVIYSVEGYNLQELLNKIIKVLPEGYCMESDFSCMLGVHHIYSNEKCKLYNLESLGEKVKTNSIKSDQVKMSGNQFDKKFNNYQKVPITYVCGEYCIS